MTHSCTCKLDNSEEVDADELTESGISMDIVKILYKDEQFLPKHLLSRFAKGKWSRTIIQIIQFSLTVLPFVLDYITDIVNSGTGGQNITRKPSLERM